MDDPSCVCDGWIPQNAAHLFVCPSVGDGVRRSWEQAHDDEEWCATYGGEVRGVKEWGGYVDNSVDRREGRGTGPGAERGTWATKRLQSIAIG